MIMLWLLAIPYMAWTSRMCGGGHPRLGRPWTQILFALPFLILLLPVEGLYHWPAILGFAGAWLGKATGHGRGQSLPEPMKAGSQPEKVEFLISWLEPHMPVYWYKALILATVGLAVTILPAVIAVWGGYPQAGLILAVAGIMKAVAYMIGWHDFPQPNKYFPRDLCEATQWGEFLTGLFGGIGVFVAGLIIWG